MLRWRVSVVVCQQAKIMIMIRMEIFVRHEWVWNWEPWINYLDGKSKNVGQNCGSAFLEFTSHQWAMTAFKCLQKRDVVFGYERTAKVEFTKSSSQVDEEIMALLYNWSNGERLVPRYPLTANTPRIHKKLQIWLKDWSLIMELMVLIWRIEWRSVWKISSCRIKWRAVVIKAW